MIKRIFTHDNNQDLEVLRTVSTSVENIIEAQEIAKDLIDTLAEKVGAVGLAAPQIGINKRIFVINTQTTRNLVMINPIIKEAMGETKGEEGCLSVEGIFKKVKRKSYIKVSWRNVHGQDMESFFSGRLAVIVQHELSHLDGKLFIDENP